MIKIKFVRAPLFVALRSSHYFDHMYLSTPAPSVLLFESRGPGRGTALPLLVVCHALPEVLHPPTEQTPEQ